MNDFRKYDEKIDAILSSMSVREKIGQLHQGVFDCANFDEVAEKIKARSIGSVILANSSNAGNDVQKRAGIETINKLQALAMEHGGIPIIIGRDVIHGHKIAYPIPLAMAASFQPELVKQCYRSIAEEAAADGIHWSFSPMADVSRDPRWGRCIESPGEDPYLGAKMAAAAIEGFQGEDYTHPQSIAACVKHFVGYGASEGGRDYAATEIGEPSLRNFYLKAFDAAVKAGVATVMTSFNCLSGIPVSGNDHLIRRILKNEFGFDGFTVSDWASVERPYHNGGSASTRKECALQGLNSGIDMEMVTHSYEEYAEALIEEGKLSIDILDDAVRRILRVKMAFGLFENHQVCTEAVDYDRHLAEAVKLAEESIVLLKNKDHILPLQSDEAIAAVGPMLHEKTSLAGSWSLDYDRNYIKSYKEALEAFAGSKITFNFSELYDSMYLASRKADKVIVLLGESSSMTGENHSMASVDIPEEQEILIKKLSRLGKKVIAVLTYGRVIATESIEPYCDAMLYAWHCGSGTAQAVVNTLFGENVPSGSLPMTMLRRTGQVPLYYNAPINTSQKRYYSDGKDPWYHGYEDMLQTPMYPFGYGLSYTTFAYTNIELKASATLDEIRNGKSIEIGIDVTNTGGYDGYETVQCYLRDEFSDISRPCRELQGFQKEFFKQGETKHIVFRLGLDELGYYDSKSTFTVDPGKFTVYIGRDAFAEQSVDFILE